MQNQGQQPTGSYYRDIVAYACLLIQSATYEKDIKGDDMHLRAALGHILEAFKRARLDASRAGKDFRLLRKEYNHMLAVCQCRAGGMFHRWRLDTTTQSMDDPEKVRVRNKIEYVQTFAELVVRDVFGGKQHAFADGWQHVG
jgi:hypothetical protein